MSTLVDTAQEESRQACDFNVNYCHYLLVKKYHDHVSRGI
jgi:hypothetical protein